MDIGLNLTPFLRIADQLEKHSEIISRIQKELQVD